MPNTFAGEPFRRERAEGNAGTKWQYGKKTCATNLSWRMASVPVSLLGNDLFIFLLCLPLGSPHYAETALPKWLFFFGLRKGQWEKKTKQLYPVDCELMPWPQIEKA